MHQSDRQTIVGARLLFDNPSVASRPTPCYWWSGADLDKDRLDWQLRQLAKCGIGGTIVGYGHLPEGGLDHESPAPFSSDWWDFFRWFVSRSAELGMTANIQEYGVIGPVLCAAAARTTGLNPGTLVEVSVPVDAPCRIDVGGEGELVSLLAIGREGQSPIVISLSDVVEDSLQWSESGEWTISVIRRRGGMIGTEPTGFDPMHPQAANAVIDLFYRRFEEELPGALGTAFKIFFQDELDLGITMPMWNDLVTAQLEAEFDVAEMMHSLWHEIGSETSHYRARYREIVVGLLEEHYFRPIFEWLDARGCLLIMDQLSRGDLRLGHDHYADFLETMRWYHGPGNDDPDLTGPRNRFAFAVSASIAQLNDRPIVPNEAFHSSGWGVAPADILRGLNEGFAAGASHVIMHGLNYTTEGGWWEWASPDFHFRQPWWAHSAPLWDYVARASSLLQVGLEQTDILVIDPSADLDVIGPETDVTERVVAIIEHLMDAGIRPTLVPLSQIASASVRQGQLWIGQSAFSTVLSPGARYVSEPARHKLRELSAAGGRLLAVDAMPDGSNRAAAGWELVDQSRLADSVQLAGCRGVVVSETPGVRIRRRVLDDGTLFFVTNHTGDTVTATLVLPEDLREPEVWELQTGQSRKLTATLGRVRFDISPDFAVVLAGRTADTTSLVQGSDRLGIDLKPASPTPAPSGLQEEVTQVELGAWTIEMRPTLDNRFLDFSSERGDLGVETVRLDALTHDGQPVASLVDHGVRMMALGPIRSHEASSVEAQIIGANSPFDAPVELTDREVPWRPYLFSPTTGLDGDPLLLDTLTGPHGLKGVPPEFIDPGVLDSDADAGSLYYFAGYALTAGAREVVRAGARAAHAVWVGGELVIQSSEIGAKNFRPWSLRDMSVTPEEIEVPTPRDSTLVVIRVEVSADQPTRAWVVMGGNGGADAPRGRLRWWWGDAPSAPYTVPGIDESVTLRVTPPPGAYQLEVTATGPVVGARLASVECSISVQKQSRVSGGGQRVVSTVTLEPEEVWSGRSLSLTVASPENLGATAGVVTRPLRWMTRAVDVDGVSDWSQWGLSDYSGMVHYSTTLTVSAPTSARLAISGLIGSARVSMNGTQISTLFSTDSSTPFELVAGDNILEIECANTLVNYYRRWPSPYAHMQRPGGGFLAATVESVPSGEPPSEPPSLLGPH